MLRIVCINSGNYLDRGVEYVNILFDMVWRNIKEDTEFQFTVFTDGDETYSEGVFVQPLPGNLKGWWNKLWLFSQFDDGDRIVFLDLDTVIVGGINDILKYEGKFAILRDFYRPNGYQSSVMLWTPCEETREIWRLYEIAGFPEIEGGDQAWIEKNIKADLLQELYPNLFVSFKVDCRLMYPKGAKVICFHGLPRPHEVKTGFTPYIWKIGGGVAAELFTECNTPPSHIEKNIRHAASLDLPWLDAVDKHNGTALIVGGGPSLLDDIEEIRCRQQNGEIIFAVNGVFNELLNHGIKSDYHVMADARAENSSFLPIEKPLKGSLYASQCHENLFSEGVTIWHPYHIGIREIIGTEKNYALVGGGPTVGLQSMVIAYLKGYRALHIFGMDSSYKDGEGHAYKQELNDGERLLEVPIEDKIFIVAPWMASQVDEFKDTATNLVHEGCEIAVHGYGLLPYVASLMEIPHKSTAAVERATSIFERLGPDPVGVEVGVFSGALSKLLLQHPTLTLYMVDSWKEHDPEGEYAKSDYHGKLSQKEQDDLYTGTLAAVSFAGGRAKVIRKDSLEAAKYFEDNSLDFVFIDADHTYEAVKKDIEAWAPKVKNGGWLCGHDYENPDFPAWGVKRAVDEFGTTETGLNYTWFINKQEKI